MVLVLWLSVHTALRRLSSLKTSKLVLVEDTGDNVAIIQSGMRSKHNGTRMDYVCGERTTGLKTSYHESWTSLQELSVLVLGRLR